jgi:hypothetical protein
MFNFSDDFNKVAEWQPDKPNIPLAWIYQKDNAAAYKQIPAFKIFSLH